MIMISNYVPLPEAEQFFMKLEQARGVLLDENKRTKYDQWRVGGFKEFLSFDNWLANQPILHSVSLSVSITTSYHIIVSITKYKM